MPEVYAKAKLVLVWLGLMDEAGLLSNVCTSIKELHEFFPSFDDNVIVSPEARQNLVAEMALRDRRESWPNTDEYDLEPLVEFIGRPWFTRKLVVQEIAVALALKILSLGGLPHIVRKIDPKDRRAFELGLFNLGVMDRVQDFLKAGRGTFVDAVMGTRGTSCSNHHNHIYAVLSCASEGPSLDPDYTLSVEDTFKKFTTVMLIQEHNLKVLSLESHKEIIVDEVKDFVPSLHEMLREDMPDLFKAYSPLSGAVDPCLQSSVRRFCRWMRASYDLANSHASVVDEVGRRDAFSRTLLCTEGGSTSSKEMAKKLSTTFKYVQWVLFQDYTSSSKQMHVSDELSQARPRLATLWGGIESAMAEKCIRRNFFVTKVGRLGQMPIGTEKGDFVCVLLGGDVPFVIRPTDHDSPYHSLIGDCFLDGIMNGETLVGSKHAARDIALV
ncbi:hypothetical protein N8I77_012275 [Diaporthe amygdali]|uniref:Uncharacterized protein n=1 Tax=Phomopsis amygdali TaxID=1214568 RepID=A0AAD9VYR4_PHOAM|nr:hypothetical protein N8I77_012275 [Diaporthe amygdali]